MTNADLRKRTELLSSSVRSGSVDELKEALLMGADPNERLKPYRWTPLMTAAVSGHAHLIKELIAAGADPNLANAGGQTPLIFACDAGKEACVMELIAAGARLEDRTRDDLQTALTVAAGQSSENCARELLLAGANPEALDRFGEGPLARAIQDGSFYLTRLLTLAGADPLAKNHEGQTPWDMAQSNPSVLSALNKAFAERESRSLSETLNPLPRGNDSKKQRPRRV